MSANFNTTAFVNSSAVANCSSSRWLTEEVFKLIDIVHSDEAIYNPRHKYYFCRPYVENFWREVDLKLDKNPGSSLAKWTNLRISFRREYTNYLEEKVTPCWSYFDRMYFLHPYLRKKHQQHKSLDTEVQNVLAHLTNLSNRMQREREAERSTANLNEQINTSTTSISHSPPPALDNYLEYFDEHEHINSELEDIIDEEQHTRIHNNIDSDIKSECEDHIDDYEHESRHIPGINTVEGLHLDHETEQDDVEQVRESEIQETTYDTLVPSSPTSSTMALSVEKRYNQKRQPHQSRLQLRVDQGEVRAKRSRPQDIHLNGNCSSTFVPFAQSHCIVRPTLVKPAMDMVSTTTNSGNNTSSSTGLGVDFQSSNSATNAPSTSYVPQRHLAHNQNQRLDASTVGISSAASTTEIAQTPLIELCDCKTDPDAMFLMSLLPDIQKLNGRDRGKIKLAFQNILQDYLYPD